MFSFGKKRGGGSRRQAALRTALLNTESVKLSLSKRVAKFQAEIDALTERAQALAHHNPNGARHVLRRRANLVYQESLLSKQLAGLEQRASQLAVALSTTQVVESAQETHRALRETHNPHAEEQVADLMDDLGDFLAEGDTIAEVAAGDADGAMMGDVESELLAMQMHQLPSPPGPGVVPAREVDISPDPPPQPVAVKHKRTGSSVEVDRLLAWVDESA